MSASTAADRTALTPEEIGAAAWLNTAPGVLGRRPDVCTLLGPTKHYRSFDALSLALGKLHWLVFSVGSHRANDDGLGTTARERRIYFDTHRRKMDLSSLAYVVDLPTPDREIKPDAIYVGRDTQAEIEFARATGLEVKFMSSTWPNGLPASPTRPPPGHGG